MLRVILHIGFVLLFFQNSFGQVRTIKPVKTHSRTTNLSIGGSLVRSVLFLTRNVKENNDAMGYHGSIIYGGSKIFRTSLEYTYYKKINIEPTWYDIKAYTVEANVHMLARFKRTKAYFYPLFGLSYNSFSGYFTGINDFQNLHEKYQVNQTAVTKWIGLNIGTGFEQFFKKVSVFGEYKMRVGVSDGTTQLNIMDVCFNIGLRYNLKVPSIYKIFSGTRNRYILDSKESED
ncbi:MAG: hypothetical protein ABIP51_22385 [Bacteroidia bacterium]